MSEPIPDTIPSMREPEDRPNEGVPHAKEAARLGPDYLMYASAADAESIWKLANGNPTELWRSQVGQITGGPAISPDGQRIAFSVRQHGQSHLYVMQADGTNARIVTDALDLQGSLACVSARLLLH